MAGERCAIESEETKLYSSGEALIPKRVRPCSEISSIAERFRWGSSCARYFIASTKRRHV
jgi:hypothetical protein